MKTFKTFNAAKKAANGAPVLRVGNRRNQTLYIVGLDKLEEVVLISGDGRITGNVTLNHLNRLGNANWAIAKNGDYASGRAFKSEEEENIESKLFTVVAVSDNTNAFGLKRVVIFGELDGVPLAFAALASHLNVPTLGKRLYIGEARRIWECVESIPAPGTALYRAALAEVAAA